MGGDAFGSARSCAYHPARRDTPAPPLAEGVPCAHATSIQMGDAA
jgi:hypothetical protein